MIVLNNAKSGLCEGGNVIMRSAAEQRLAMYTSVCPLWNSPTNAHTHTGTICSRNTFFTLHVTAGYLYNLFRKAVFCLMYSGIHIGYIQ